ncbi:MAG: HAMP domain-containing histidine kinase [Schleiferiaceae bacterium]|nr:HAMP domain-containing histidine kinase [Schleiferiaceae bacterium]
MLLIFLVAFVLTGTFSLYHFRSENKQYHFDRLTRKENAMISHLDYITNDYQGQGLTESQWRKLLSERVKEVSSIHHLDMGVYSKNGKFISGSLNYTNYPKLFPPEINSEGTTNLPKGSEVVIVDTPPYLIGTSTLFNEDGDLEFIIRVPYQVSANDIPDEDYNFLRRLAFIYVALFILGIVMALFLSNYISKNMRAVSERLKEFRLNQSNEKLEWRFKDEIGELISEYNIMVEKLEKTAVELAQSERESAWKEMAQQVAHEIKNPLTPMKLTLQMMQREKDIEELHSMTANLLEEIESLSHIAEAFSLFAQMPALSLDTEDVSYLTNRAASLYLDQGVRFVSAGPLTAKVDKEQWTRVIHNLIKNAVQSIPEDRERDILITATKADNKAMISVQDNGGGIPEDMQQKIFEPNFTTKSSGMGLGLAMVKNLVISFGGAIGFDTSEKGTTFIIVLPLVNPKQK